MTALCVPYPNSVGTGHKQIAVGINFNPIWDPFVRSALLFPEHVPVGKVSIACNVVHTYVSLFAVVHVKALAIR